MVIFNLSFEIDTRDTPCNVGFTPPVSTPWFFVIHGDDGPWPSVEHRGGGSGWSLPPILWSYTPREFNKCADFLAGIARDYAKQPYSLSPFSFPLPPSLSSLYSPPVPLTLSPPSSAFTWVTGLRPRFLENLRIKKISFDIIMGPACPRLRWSKAILLGGSTWLSECVRALHFPLLGFETGLERETAWNYWDIFYKDLLQVTFDIRTGNTKDGWKKTINRQPFFWFGTSRNKIEM